MKRRHFVASMLGTALIAPTHSGLSAADQRGHGGHDDGPVGPLASATVSFGAWPPGDRLNPPAPPPAPPPNVHALTPHEVVIKRGGTVNFIIAGFHNVVVYAPPKRVQDVNFTNLIPTPGAPDGFPGIIEDAEHRVFRGFVDIAMPLDRVEVVHFPRRGRHLVICGFSPHFNENEKMFGWVRVV
jgi:plastocyanin